MQKCENCGNEYANAFQVIMQGKEHVFDSFECAINALSPRCACCDTRVIGHGVETEGRIYCCSHCAESSEFKDFRNPA